MYIFKEPLLHLCESDCLLSILLKGSEGSSSKTISEEQFLKGSEAIERIYLEALDLITHNPQGELQKTQTTNFFVQKYRKLLNS